ncbi:MAG: hypothetical protein EA378_06615 [Phycisphaerales bacterium]|nr:MAG: hypothetical protein EA378_06615 [Phycisphaerales bacterium]
MTPRAEAEARYAAAQVESQARIEAHLQAKIPFPIDPAKARQHQIESNRLWREIEGVQRGVRLAWPEAAALIESDTRVGTRAGMGFGRSAGEALAAIHTAPEWTPGWDQLAVSVQNAMRAQVDELFRLYMREVMSEGILPLEVSAFVDPPSLWLPLRGAVVQSDWYWCRRVFQCLAFAARDNAERSLGIDPSLRPSLRWVYVSNLLAEVASEYVPKHGMPVRILDEMVADYVVLRPDRRVGFATRRLVNVEAARLRALHHELGLSEHPYFERFGAIPPARLAEIGVELPAHADAASTVLEAERLWDLIERAIFGDAPARGAAVESIASRREWWFRHHAMLDAEPLAALMGGDEILLVDLAMEGSPHLRYWAALPERVDMGMPTISVGFSDVAVTAGHIAQVAVERYRHVHGVLPATLDVPVAELNQAMLRTNPRAGSEHPPFWPRWRRGANAQREGGPAVPQVTMADVADPFSPDGAPIVYRPAVDEPRGYVLYSVGMNGTDDGWRVEGAWAYRSPDIPLSPTLQELRARREGKE